LLIPNDRHSDPFIVLVLSLSFIASIFFLHISAKIIRAFSK
jgi:protein transport protein SEC61 subunit beta